MTAIIATPAALTTDLTEELAALIDAALEIRDLTAPLSFVDFFDGDEGDEENEGNEGDEDDEDNEGDEFDEGDENERTPVASIRA